MNGYERAVLDAAKNYRERVRHDRYADTVTLECAVDALVESESNNGPVERLAEWITACYPNTGNDGKGARAVNCLMRSARHVGAKTLQQIADADPRSLRDIRGTGPKTLAIWAEGLRALGIEPAWAGDLTAC